MAKKVTKLKYPGEARMLRGGTSWFYEQPSGLIVVSEVDCNGFPRAATTTLPWAKVLKAAENHKRIKRSRVAR